MTETRSSLLRRVRDFRDGSSWEEFDRLYRPMLRRYALTRGLPFEDADEVAQECMTAVVSAIGGFQRQISFRGWLRAMVNNQINLRLRKRHGERNATSGELADAATAEPNPVLVWERHWNQAHLMYCLELIRDEVAPLTFEAFDRYVIREEPVESICAQLKLTPNQVYVAKHRVLSRIKERWAELTDGVL